MPVRNAKGFIVAVEYKLQIDKTFITFITYKMFGQRVRGF